MLWQVTLPPIVNKKTIVSQVLQSCRVINHIAQARKRALSHLFIYEDDSGAFEMGMRLTPIRTTVTDAVDKIKVSIESIPPLGAEARSGGKLGEKRLRLGKLQSRRLELGNIWMASRNIMLV